MEDHGSNHDRPSHSGHYYTHGTNQIYIDQSQLPERVPPIHRVLMHDPGLMDVAALRHSQYLAQVLGSDTYIKSELPPYDDQAPQQQLRPEYSGSAASISTHYLPRMNEDISTELLKLHHANLVNAEMVAAATSLPQPLNLQQNIAAPQYKHPMLHLYDAAMQQQQEEGKFKYDNISSSSDSNDSDDDDEDTTPSKTKDASDNEDVHPAMPVELVVPKAVQAVSEDISSGDSESIIADLSKQDATHVSYIATMNQPKEGATVETKETCGSVGTQKLPYDCSSCGTCFIVQCGSSGHTIIDGGTARFNCELCQESFVSVNTLQAHVKGHYDKSGPVDLRKAGSTAGSQKAVDAPGKTERTAKYAKPECGICGQRFNTKVNLKKHEKTHSREKPYGCSSCRGKFPKVESLNAHECVTKAKEKLFNCDLCERGFAAEIGLLSHRRSCHKLGVSFKCHICKARFNEEHELNVHLENHNKDALTKENAGADNQKHTEESKKSASDAKPLEKSNPPRNTRSSVKLQEAPDKEKDDCKDEDDSYMDDSETDEYDDSFDEKVDSNIDEHIDKFAEQLSGGTLACVICDQKFTEKDDLKVHVRKHFIEEYRDSEKLAVMNEQLKADSSSTEKFNCHICEKSFPSSFGLGIHISTHRIPSGDQYKCTFCGDAFSYKSCLKKHLKRQHGDKAEVTKSTRPQPMCEICGRKFKDAINLRRHAIVHEAEKQFNCTFCGKCFSRHDGLRAHVRTHTGEKPYKCGVCGVTCATSSGLNIHKKSHNNTKPFSCHICGKLYKYRLSLNLHLSTHSGKKPYTCDVCGRSFYDPSSFKKHKVIHTGVKSHVCHICGNSFFRRESLTKHIKTHNPNYTKKLHPCSQCKKVYNTASGLIIHKRTHSGEKPFKCEFCSRFFATKSTLLSHSRTHSGEKPYVCECCGKRFIQATPLKMHMKRVHNPAAWTAIDGLPSSTTAKHAGHDPLPTQVPTTYAYELMYGYTHPQSIALHTDAHPDTHWTIPAGVLTSAHSHPTAGAVVLDERNTALLIEQNRLLPEQQQARLMSDAHQHGVSYTGAMLTSSTLGASSMVTSGMAVSGMAVPGMAISGMAATPGLPVSSFNTSMLSNVAVLTERAVHTPLMTTAESHAMPHPEAHLTHAASPSAMMMVESQTHPANM